MMNGDAIYRGVIYSDVEQIGEVCAQGLGENDAVDAGMGDDQYIPPGRIDDVIKGGNDPQGQIHKTFALRRAKVNHVPASLGKKFGLILLNRFK